MTTNEQTKYAYCVNCDAYTGWYIGETDGKKEIACDTCEEMWHEESETK